MISKIRVHDLKDDCICQWIRTNLVNVAFFFRLTTQLMREYLDDFVTRLSWGQRKKIRLFKLQSI